jgi:hypothetical protein
VNELEKSRNDNLFLSGDEKPQDNRFGELVASEHDQCNDGNAPVGRADK